MKLIYCPRCQDVLKLRTQSMFRYCSCKESFGRYLDGLNLEIGGEAIPIGFNNLSFVNALLERPEKENGVRFEAFIIPKICSTVEKV